MRRARGLALGTVLMLVAAAMMVAFTMVAVVSFQMSTGLRQTGAHAAHNAAESALAVAIARIGDSGGTFGSAGSEEVRVDGLDGEVGIVTFVDGVSEVRQQKTIAVPPSTHNFTPLNPTTAKPGYAGTVPKDSIQLVATGITQSGVVSRVESVVYFPPFTYALASSGALSLNEVLVAGVKDPTTVAHDSNGAPIFDLNNLATGDVGSNATLDLTTSTIKGDAQAAGVIHLSGSTVEGETRQGYGPLKLPTFNLSDFDPGTQTVARELDDVFDEPVLSGNARRTGDLTIPGDLKLDNGLLYVTGNLGIAGGLRGKGIVVVHGNATVAGSLSVAATDDTALLCDGNITISGGAVFQGLVYTKGAFTAANVTLVGTFIQNSPSAANGMHLDSCKVAYQNSTATVSIFRPASFLVNEEHIEEPLSKTLPNYDGTSTTTVLVNGEPAPGLDALVRPDRQSQWYTEEFGEYCHRHELFTVTKRNGQIVYTQFIRGRAMDGYDDAPPARMLLPNSPWASMSTTVYPGRCISVQETYNLQDILDMRHPHEVWMEVDPAKCDALMHACVTEAMSVNVPIAAAQQVNFQFNPSRFLTPYDEMRVMFQADL